MHFPDAMTCERKALLLSAGYGRGHHSAARALAEELQCRGWQVEVLDVCEAAHPHIFRLTQRFYLYCVRHAPKLWGKIYRYLDEADWPSLIHKPGVAGCARLLRRTVQHMQPRLVVCTYPLYAFMLDAMAAEGSLKAPYAVVVTDSLAISRPWVSSQAGRICLPDELSHELVLQEHGLPAHRAVAAGFPVRAAFTPGDRPLPGPAGEGLHIVYAAHAPLAQVQADIHAMLTTWPAMRISLLVEERRARLEPLLHHHPEVTLLEQSQDMAPLLQRTHIYIGKAGAASVFEAYAAEVPFIVNYELPGQEQGNTRLLRHDGAGYSVADTAGLLQALHDLLDHEAQGWQQARAAMHRAARTGGAARTIDALEQAFFTP